MSVRDVAVTPSLLHIDSILSRLTGSAALGEVCRFLREEFSHYRWVGVYRRDGSELVLVAWDGDAATEHPRIPIDRGLCGRAVRDGRTVVVDDVRSAPEYLACFPETRSEIVVPIFDGPEAIAEIDIDGIRVGAFDRTDGAFLERVAGKLTAAAKGADAPPARPA